MFKNKEIEIMSLIEKVNITDYDEDKVIKSKLTENTLAWVWPLTESDLKQRKIKKIEHILVKSVEKALVLHNEVIINEINNGLYKINSDNGAENIKVVFVPDTQFEMKWGIPRPQGVITEDNIKIGASGSIVLKITSIEIFHRNVIKQKMRVLIDDLRPQLNMQIRQAMRETVSQYPIEEIQKIGKDDLAMFLEPALVDTMTRMGLGSIDFSLTGLGIPPEFRIY